MQIRHLYRNYFKKSKYWLPKIMYINFNIIKKILKTKLNE